MPPSPPPLDDLEELDDLDEPAPLPVTGPPPGRDGGPLLVLYGTLLVLTCLVAAGHFLTDPRCHVIGFLLLAAVLCWLLPLWALGSDVGATAWRFILGACVGLIGWYAFCRLLLPQMSEASNAREVFLNGAALAAGVGGLLGWLLLRRLRARR